MKCVAAFFVVVIHCGASLLSPVTSTAVPIFFLISGYYYPLLVGSRFSSHIRKLLVMVIGSSTLFGVYFFSNAFRHGTLTEWIAATFSLDVIVENILKDLDLFGGHLWFIWASIYDLLLLRLLDKFGLSKSLSFIVPILLLIFFAFNFTPYDDDVRNWLFMGLPCMCIGRWIREDEKKWLKVFSTPRCCRAIAVVSFILICAEFSVQRFFLGFLPRNMYIFTLPLVVSVFYMALRNPDFGKDSFVSKIGHRYSAFIYIIHYLINCLFSSYLGYFDGWKKYIVYPVVVFMISLLMAMLWGKLKSFMLKKLGPIEKAV